MKAEMTENDIRALHLLVFSERLVRPQHFGTLMWPGKGRNGSAPLARAAGAVLKRLVDRGYAEWHSDGLSSKGEWGHRATKAGRVFVYAFARKAKV